MKKTSTKKQITKPVSKVKTPVKSAKQVSLAKTSTTTKNASKTPVKSVTTKTTTSDKSVKSVENGIKVIQYAIKNKTSISEAARKNGHGRNYVSDIKARIDKNLKSRSIKRDLYDTFKSLSKTYDKTIG